MNCHHLVQAKKGLFKKQISFPLPCMPRSGNAFIMDRRHCRFMASKIKGSLDMTEADFLASKGKGTPIHVPMKFWASNGESFDVTANVSPGSPMNFDVSYEGFYSFEEAASDNGRNFKEEIEESLHQCSCSWEEYINEPSDNDDDSREESDLSFTCRCTSPIPSKFTKAAFKLMNNEARVIAAIASDAFGKERTAY